MNLVSQEGSTPQGAATSTVSFRDLGLVDALLSALTAEGYSHPTPIQQRSIPHVLAQRDLIGCAQTGTGKTAAFALPILQLLAAKPRARTHRAPPRVLVLSPTRELAAQIEESFQTYGKNLRLSHAVLFGGVGQAAQERTLAAGVDVLVATPGRLLDLVEQRHADLSQVEIFVLDEADRMLDMGFLPDVRRVIARIPSKRQTLLFSATFPRDIEELATSILKSPMRVEVTPVATTAEKIAQSVYFVDKADKRSLLDHLLKDAAITRALVFTRTKHGANRVAEQLEKSGVRAAAIHGNKSQNARERALDGFKDGSLRVLVATDIAARGIDVDGVSHVVNYDLPNVAESYVHRIGRTARAGAEGVAFAFCDQEERTYLADIEKLIRLRVPRISDHPFASRAPADLPSNQLPPPPKEHNGGGHRGGHGRSHQGQARGNARPQNGAQARGSSNGNAKHAQGGQSRGSQQGRPAQGPSGRPQQGGQHQGRPAQQGGQHQGRPTQNGGQHQSRPTQNASSQGRPSQGGSGQNRGGGQGQGQRRQHTGDVPQSGAVDGRVQGWAGGRRPGWPSPR